MIIKLTKLDGSPVLVGVESIIDAEEVVHKPYTGGSTLCTKIQSRGAMISTNWVTERVDEIWDMVNKKVASRSKK